MQQDAYVLVKVFHKKNIGPPSANRYAPFIEEEWADDGVVRVRAEPLPVANGNNQMGQVCTSFTTKKLLSFIFSTPSVLKYKML